LSRIIIDVRHSHFWDITGINALDRVMLKFRHHGIPVEIVGLNEASAGMIERLGTHRKEGAALPGGH
jgi:SulP family sulfate permease